jgi:hypothetical protein
LVAEACFLPGGAKDLSAPGNNHHDPVHITKNFTAKQAMFEARYFPQ